MKRDVAVEFEEVERDFNEAKQRVQNANRFSVEMDEYVREMKSLLNQSGSNDDEDIEQFDLETPRSIPKCPFTQLPIDDPVKNTHCGHVYSREGAMSYIEHQRNNKKQPKYELLSLKSLILFLIHSF